MAQKITIWQAIAITSIVVNILLFSFVGWLLIGGDSLAEAKFDCRTRVCADAKFMHFDGSNKLCSCYDENGDVYTEEYLKW